MKSLGTKNKYGTPVVPHKDNQFNKSIVANAWTYVQNYQRLMEMAISMWEWTGLPDTVDARFLEYTLFTDGQCVFFEDEVLGYLGLQCAIGGQLSVYRIPLQRTAYAANGYNKHLTDEDSVIIFNNLLHTNSQLDTEIFAKRLYELDRTIEVNCKAQKTPVLIKCDENERLTMKNMYMKYDGNQPYIFGTKSLNTNDLTVLKTDAPFVAPSLYDLRMQIWGEALSYLGISSSQVQKAERVSTVEVNKSLGATVAARYSRLMARKQACAQINKMFGLNIDVEFRTDIVETFETEMGRTNSSQSEVEANE